MPTSLESIKLKFQQRIHVLDSGFERQFLAPVLKFRIDRFSIQEGYVSALWQSWSGFCRSLIIESSRGAITASGLMTTSPHQALPEMSIASIAKKLAYNKPINNITPLSGSHQEHTWGDTAKMNLVSTGINCSNSPTITAAVGVCISLSDLQLCRNASAHIGKSLIDDIRSAKVRYVGTRFSHPSDMIYWIDPVTNDFLWKSWIDEMMFVSDLAVM